MKVIASGQEQITLYFGNQTLNRKPYYHTGIDVVRQGNRLDAIVAAEKGNYIVTTDVLNVRKGPGTSCAQVKYTDLTDNAKAQAQMKELVNYPANGYVKGIEFTALEIRNLEGESWARTPSGWICIYNKDVVYCKKR